MANREIEFFNFLKKYDLDQYHERLKQEGISKISHLQHVKGEDLEKVGMTKPEQKRLLGKYEQHFSKFGKFKDVITGKSKKYSATPNAIQAMQRANVDNAILIDERDIRIVSQIGEGAHGIVYEAEWESSNGRVKVAVKELNDNDDMMFLTEFLKEASVMLNLRHSNIIRMHGVILSPIRLIEEFAPMGDLLSYLKVNGTLLPVSQTHKFAEQIASAMLYLEEMRLLHRDLAARNILVCDKNTLKLSDFGMARVLDDFSEVYKLSNLAARVPIAWSALEVLTEAKFSTASDVWSYGVTLWEIYSAGTAPWKGLNPIEIRDHLLAGERLSKPKRCHKQIHELMQRCWYNTIKDRPRFQAIHTNLQNIRYEQVLTIKECLTDDDDGMLSYGPHELITVIDKNSEDWWTGIHNESGRFGHFQVSHVTHDLTPLETLKSNIKSKKKHGSSIAIGKPTNLVHKAHVGFDGTQWSSESNSTDLISAGQNHARSHSSGCTPYLLPQPTVIPTGNLIELEDEMHNISVSSSSPHYDTPRSHPMAAKSQSDLRTGHPVPKPRQKLPPQKAIVSGYGHEGEIKENFQHPNQSIISSQYSQLDADFTDPTALVVTSRPDQYINSKRESLYENIGYQVSDEQHYLNTEGTGRYNDSTGELVIQAGRRASAFARTSYTPHGGEPENNGAAAMTSNQPYGQNQLVQPRVMPPADNHTGNEIRYPPPLMNRLSYTLPAEQDDHNYDTLRYVPHNQMKSQTLTPQRNLSPSPPPPAASLPYVRPTGQYAHLIDRLKEELPQASEEICIRYLNENKGNVELTLQDLKVHILMDMGLDKADMESCRKALGHCQWKLDRAAEWLIEQSFS